MNDRKLDFEIIEKMVKKNMFDENDDPYSFTRLPKHIQVNLATWCVRYQIRTTTNHNHTSYGLKKMFEEWSGHYITNGDFKGAMLVAGFTPHDIEAKNWKFNIEENSIKIDRQLIKDNRDLKKEQKEIDFKMNLPENKQIVETITARIEEKNEMFMLGYNACKRDYGLE